MIPNTLYGRVYVPKALLFSRLQHTAMQMFCVFCIVLITMTYNVLTYMSCTLWSSAMFVQKLMANSRERI